MIRLRVLIIILGVFLYLPEIQAQSVPVGLLDNTDDYFRRQQLLGKDTSSFMIRPLHYVPSDVLNKVLWKNPKENIVIAALPVVWQQQYNTDHPYGINDGAMIPARGYQTMFSAGIEAKIGPLHIQLRPEVVYAENRFFKGVFDSDNSINIKNNYKVLLNVIDLPERYGDQSYSKINWGQSSIRLNAGPVSIGLSHENLWWGPGTRNSLLMTNNAEGFLHATFNTLKPIKTFIGSFEFQGISGKLDPSGIIPFVGYQQKPKSWRYINGLVFTYQPKWLPGLYFGADRSFIVYRSQMGRGFNDYFPVFSGLTKNNFAATPGDGLDSEDLKIRDQRISVFARWIMKEAKAEIYFQYGREDHSKDVRDLVVEPEHTRAYVVGFRKLVKLNKPDEFIQFGIELTKLEASGSVAVRNSGYWYTHSQVRDGYTQLGQVLGAGIGPGSNLQTIDINWIKGWNKIGFQVERYVHNNSLYERTLALTKGDRNSWVDYSFAAKYEKEYKKFIFNSQLTYIKSSNYEWVIEDNSNNLQLRIGVMYRW